MGNCDCFGVYFVSEDIQNHKDIERMIEEKEFELIEEAKDKFNKWLSINGLENIMGIIVKEGEFGGESRGH